MCGLKFVCLFCADLAVSRTGGEVSLGPPEGVPVLAHWQKYMIAIKANEKMKTFLRREFNYFDFVIIIFISQIHLIMFSYFKGLDFCAIETHYQKLLF